MILNEVGLDPGIDHLLIMKSIDEIHARGGTVSELVSLCGGLPDPVAADNPLRYKMSWSPKVRMVLIFIQAVFFQDLFVVGRSKIAYPLVAIYLVTAPLPIIKNNRREC